MSKVMIHPASYESMHQALDRAFEIFPLRIQDKKGLDKTQRAVSLILPLLFGRL